MATATVSTGTDVFLELAFALEAAVEEDAEDRASEICRTLNAAVFEAISARDLARMAELASQIGVLTMRLDARRADGVAVAAARGSLATMLDSLERSRAGFLTARNAERNRRELLVLPDRIVEELREPLRPRDLAESLSVDPTQVSRALRLLVDEGKVEQTTTPAGASDRRAVWYRAMPSKRHRTEATPSSENSEAVAVQVGNAGTLVTLAGRDVRVIGLLDVRGEVIAVSVHGKRTRRAAKRERESLASALRALR